MPNVHHAIDYVELMAPDLERVRAFYEKAFGWTFQAYGPDYLGVQGKDRELGGIARGEPRPAGGPLVVLYSNDLDATLASAKAAGAKITREPFTFPGGRRFHFADPAGNELGVWSPD